MNKSQMTRLTQYLKDTLHVPVSTGPCSTLRDIPRFLGDDYQFFQMRLLNVDCILMIDTCETEHTPALIAKHMEQIRLRHSGPVIYACGTMTSYNRKRLIEQRVPFVVPGNQMYLPWLAIDLREHMTPPRDKKPLFSPATQVLILRVLWRAETEPLTPSRLAGRLGYSAMTMTRAFNELKSCGIGEHSVAGKERRLRFPEKGERLWEQALPLLTTPVRERLSVATVTPIPGSVVAGESALARYTPMSAPRIPVHAVFTNDWRTRRGRDQVPIIPHPDTAGQICELWKYEPVSLSQNGTVDRLSLFLALKNSPDERIQSALDMLIKDMTW